jgi:hypothetical protein
VLVALVGCAADIDPPWQLDHDRIVAVRATPPHIPAGATSQIDLLVSHSGLGTAEVAPDAGTVVAPMRFASAMSGQIITCPSDADLDAARAELGIEPGMPVPLTIGVLSGSLPATKTVWLGDTQDNPTLDNITVGGVTPAPGVAIAVPPDMDVPLSVDADEDVDIINWLTSAGTMHDFDLHAAHLHVLPADPQAGELALVLRQPTGGVAWQVWPISVQ